MKTKKAVERNIEIIGEAVNRILKTDDNFPLDEAKNIIGTRNRIIHSMAIFLMKLSGQSLLGTYQS